MLVDNFFIFWKSTQDSPTNLNFRKNWLEFHKLNQVSNAIEEPIMPIIKFHPNSFEQFYPYKKCDLSAIFQILISEIEKVVLSESCYAEVELRFFGKVVRCADKITFLPPTPHQSNMYQTFDVQTVNKFPSNKTVINQNFKLPQIRGKDIVLERPMEVLVNQDNTNYEKKNPRNLKLLKNKIGQKKEEQENGMKRKEEQSKKLTPSEAQFISAKEQNRLLAEKYKSDTFDNFDFDKNQYFSQQFKLPKDIWNQQYVRYVEIANDLPKILEKHSQTKAKPVALMFNSLSVSSRIAINYTPLAKYLYLDPSNKKITILYNNENNIFAAKKTQKTENGKANRPDNGSKEQLYSGDDSNSDDEATENYEKEMVSHKKFYQYVNTLIKEDEVIDFSPKLMENLKEHAKKCLKEVQRTNLEEFLNEIFAEIKSDFKQSLKKGILQYLLKDKEERMRLELPYLPDKPDEYGAIKTTKMTVNGTQGIVKHLNAFLAENLMLFSNETNQILDFCAQFDDLSFFNLEMKDSGIGIFDFLDQQRNQYTKVKSFIAGDWMRGINDIYKKKSQTIKKKQLKIFVDTMGAVVSGQLRQLTEKSLIQISDFFRQFDSNNNDSVEDVYQRYQSVSYSLEKYFLVIGLKEKDNGLIFENPIEAVTEDLIEQIKEVVRNTGNVSSTENFLFRGGKCTFDPISMTEPFVENSINRIRDIITKNFTKIEDFELIFRDFYYLFEEKTNLINTISQGIDQESLLHLFQKYTRLEEENVKNFPSEIPFNMIKINASTIKEQLISIPIELRKIIEDHVYKEIDTLSTQIIKTLKSNFDGLTTRIENVEKLIEKETWLNNFKAKDFPNLQTNYLNIVKWYDRFSPFIKFSFDKLKHIYEAKEQILDYRNKIEKEEVRIRNERETLEKRLIGRKGVVNSKATELANKIETYRKEGKAFWIEKMIIDITESKNNLQMIVKDIEAINREEELMGFPKSEFENVKNSASSILLFESFWRNIADWTTEHEKLEKTIIFKLDIEKVVEKCNSIHKNLLRLLGEMKTNKIAGIEPMTLGDKTVASIELFNKDFEIVKYFCNEGLSARHWIEINKYLHANGIDVKLESGGTYYISTLKDLNLNHLQSGIAEISGTATKEWENEKFLLSVESQFENSNFEMKEYKHSTEMYVMSQQFSENTILTINSNLLRIELMISSPYAAVFRDKISELQKILSTTSTIVQLWVKLQSQWIYLEPIFNTDDVVKSLPQESMRFKEVQVSFRGFVLARKRDPSFKELNFDPDLTKKLSTLIEMLENVDKNLENYLDKKRNDFPRLYFLSSESLIEMIANVKIPSKINKQVKILFSGINNLKINANEEIEGLISFQGEQLNFTQKIAIKNFKGHVERWLTDLEETIVYEVKKNLINSLQDYAKTDKNNFFFGRIAQNVLTVILTAWTFETENSITMMGYKGLKDNIVEIDKYISSIAGMIPRFTVNHERLTLESVIAVNIHNKTVLECLIDQKIQKLSDYCWESQLRHYWEQNNVVENSTSKIQMMYSSMYYGYEYVGSCTRFIRTPITDRCFRSFFVASQMFFGNCLEGPSATGKTETVKEFSYLAGKFLFVVNGSSLIDSKTSLRILKGLVSSGNWACFDEFNRVDMSVLSVISQQLQRIQLAMSQGKHEFLFNGSMVKFKNNCMIFVTVNSGFADTAELPENIKFLFRSTAVVKPDIQFIAETQLFSAGFITSKELSFKLISLFDFCRSLFKSHAHYDFTLRTILLVVREAFYCHALDKTGDETQVLLQSVLRVLGLKFTNSDFKSLSEILSFYFTKDRVIQFLNNPEDQTEFSRLFNEITKLNQANSILSIGTSTELVEKLKEDLQIVAKDESKKSETPEQKQSDLKAENKAEFQFRNQFCVEPNIQLISKMTSIKTIMKVTHSMLLLGDTMTGKSKIIDLICKTDPSVRCIKLNPCAMESKDLFGYFDSSSFEWFPGVLQTLFNSMAETHESVTQNILLFDGFLHSSWIENLNTLIDDSKRLVLPNGDTYFLPENSTILFETDSIQNISPATISRCGVVYFDIENLNWKVMMKSWMGSYSFFSANELEKIELFFLAIYEPILKASRSMVFKVKLNDNQIFRTFSIIAHEYLMHFADHPTNESLETKDKLAIIDQALIFSLIWSLGVLICDISIKAFDLLVKKSSKTPDKNVPTEIWKQFRKVTLPENGMVFDQQLVFIKNDKEKVKLSASWKSWTESPLQDFEISLSEKRLTGIVALHEHNKYLKIASKFMAMNESVMICGPVGTGKTTLLNLIKTRIDTNSCLIREATFCSSTKALNFNNLIKKSYSRKINESIHFPVNNKNKVILIIEDLNMGNNIYSNTKSSLEFARFLKENSAFYDLEDSNKRLKFLTPPSIIGTVTLYRKFERPSPRVLSQFCLLLISDFEDESLNRIFSKILLHHFNDSFTSSVLQKIPKLVTTTIDVVKETKRRFSPCGSNAKYLLSIRDMFKIAVGITNSQSSVFKSLEDVFRLFVHECWNHIGEKMTEEQDQQILLHEIIKPIFVRNFSTNFELAIGFSEHDDDQKSKFMFYTKKLMYSAISNDDYNPKSHFMEIQNRHKLVTALESIQTKQFNNNQKLKPLVFFNKVVEGIVRLHRVFSEFDSHCIFVENNEIAFLNIVEFVCAIKEMELVKLCPSKYFANQNWKETVVKALIDAAKGKHIAFYVYENSLLVPEVADYLSLIVNNNMFMNLFTQEQIDEMAIIEEPEVEEPKTSDDIIKVIRTNFHIILYFSPTTHLYQSFMSNMPSFVSCFQTSFSSSWSEEVLRNVAMIKLNELESDSNKRMKFENAMVQMHHSMNDFYSKFSIKKQISFQNETSNFEKMMTYFSKVYNEYHPAMMQKITQFEHGYKMLVECEDMVFRQQEKLEEIRPILAESNDRIAKIVNSIEEKTKIADEKERAMAFEQQRIKNETENAKIITQECQYEVNLIQPEIDRAKDEIMKIKRSDLDDLRSMKSPAFPVQLAMQSLCLILNVKPELKRDGVTGRNNPDWWATSKQLLNNLSVETLLNFSESKSLDEVIFKRLDSFLSDQKTKEFLDENSIKFSSPTASSLFLWVTGQMNFYKLGLLLAPKRIALEEASKKLEKLQKIGEEATKDFEEAQFTLNKLKAEYAIYKEEKHKAEQAIETLLKKAEFAKRLLETLPDEKKRWEETVQELKKKALDLPGNILLLSGFLTYLGILDFTTRFDVLEKWKDIFIANNLVSETYSVEKSLSGFFSPLKMQEWVNSGLSNDCFSIDNSISLELCDELIYIHDPHLQAKKWIIDFYKRKTVVFTKSLDPQYQEFIQNSLTYGYVLVIEEFTFPVDSRIEAIIKTRHIPQSIESSAEGEEQAVQLHKDFKLILLSTELKVDNTSNDLSDFVFINNEITKEGLSGQILSQLLSFDKPELEKSYQECLVENAKNTSELETVENKLIEIISGDKTGILDDIAIIEILTESKKLVLAYNDKQAQLSETYSDTVKARKEYKDLATKISSMYIVASNFSKINPMYQLTLENFLECLLSSLQMKQANRNINQRLTLIENTFLMTVCASVCRGLFIKDKAIFVTIMVLTLDSAQAEKLFEQDLLNFVLIPRELVNIYIAPNDNYKWINDTQWKELHYLGNCSKKMKDLCFEQKIIESVAKLMKPENNDFMSIPDVYKEQINEFEQFCLLKTMHPDKTQHYMERYIEQKAGENFLKQIFEVEFEQVMLGSSLFKPIVLFLKDGQDPFSFLNTKLSSKTVIVENVIVGKNQTLVLTKVLEESVKNGNWILLQTFSEEYATWCALVQKIAFMKASNYEIAKSFRMFISCTSDKHVPLSILKNSVHFAVEEPHNVKRALRRILEDDLLNNQEFHDSCDKKKILQQIAMPLCFIHSALQERSRIGEGGFNSTYRFGPADFKITLQQLQILLSKLGDDFSIDIIKQYMVECNYGAKMTNNSDLDLLTAIIEGYLNSDTLKTGKLNLNPDDLTGEFVLSDLNSRQKAVDFANSLPDEIDSELIGIDEEKLFEGNMNDYRYLKKSLPKVFSNVKKAEKEKSEYLTNRITRILQSLPAQLDASLLLKKFPINNNYVNLIIVSEIEKFNTLISKMKIDLESSLKSTDLCFLTNQDPNLILNMIRSEAVSPTWTFWEFSQVFTLTDFLNALTDASTAFQQIISNGKLPEIINLTIFSNQQALLQAIKMNFSAQHSVSMETLFYKFSVMSDQEKVTCASNSFVFGGFYLNYADYEFDEERLVQRSFMSDLQKVNIRMDILSFQNVETSNKIDVPVFMKRVVSLKEDSRVSYFANVFEIPMLCEETPNTWIRAGVKLVAFKA